MALEVAGVTAQHLAAQEDAQATHDRASGISDAMRGNVTGDATARENLIAYDAGTIRSAWVDLKFQDLQRRIMRKVAYHFDSDDDISYDLGPEARGQFLDEQGREIRAPRLVGGYRKGESRDEWQTWDYRIESGSTARPTEAGRQAKLMAVDETIQVVATMGPQTPYIDWERYVELRAELAEVPELVEMFDTEGMAVMGALQAVAGATQPPGGGGGAKGQPRHAREIMPGLPPYGGGGGAIGGSPSAALGAAAPGSVVPGGGAPRSATPRGAAPARGKPAGAARRAPKPAEAGAA